MSYLDQSNKDAIDIARLRRETSGCDHVVHFNNAGASLPPDSVVQAVIDHLVLEQRVGGYEAESQAQQSLSRFYQALAEMLSCRPSEIAYAENATRAWDMAFYAIPFRTGDRILTSAVEYASNFLAFLQIAQRRGVAIKIVPNDANGQIDVAALEAMIDERVKLIAITHVPTNNGLINPAIAIGRIARKYNILYLLDACQSVGQMIIDVQEIGCDILSGTGRKYLRGPRGTGFLYVRKAIIESLDPPFIDLHAAKWVSETQYTLRVDARRFENWESYVAGKIGLTVAVDYCLSIGLGAIRQRVNALAELLRARLEALKGIEVHDQGIERCGLVTFTKANESPLEIQRRLALHRINISVSQASATLIDMRRKNLPAVARASVHYYNTEAEIDRLCSVLQSQ